MKDLVLDRRTHVLAWATAVVLLWPLFVVPGGSPWSGIVWTVALIDVLVVASTGFVARAQSHSMTQVVPSFDAGPKAIADAARPRQCAGGAVRAVMTECAEQRKEA